MKRLKTLLLKNLSHTWVLGVWIFFFYGLSSGLCTLCFATNALTPSSFSPAHRAALENRLLQLEAKKEFLEKVPGSLLELQGYQRRIDRLRRRLGLPITPFPLTPEGAITPSSAALARSQNIENTPEAVDFFHESKDESTPPSKPQQFFHDPTQITAVHDAINQHGGIHPHTSLLKDLPRTNLRVRSSGSRKGVVIDGEAPKPKLTAHPPHMAPPPSGFTVPTHERDGDPLPQPILSQPSLSQSLAVLPAAVDQGRIGWSAPPPPMEMAFPPRDFLDAQRQMDAPPPPRPKSPPRDGSRWDHGCSFNPKKLVGVWARG